jgi:hypothetical protein
MSILTLDKNVASAQHALAEIADRVRIEMRPERIGADSCILASKMLITVLHKIGNRTAYPLVTRCYVFNRPLAERMQSEERFIPANEIYPPEFSIGVGFGENSGTKFGGHLVVGVKAQGRLWLVDPSLDQASRKEQGLEFSSVATEMTPAFVKGKDFLTMQVLDGIARGSLIMYERWNNSYYKHSQDWRKGAIGGPALAIDRVVAWVNAQVAEEQRKEQERVRDPVAGPNLHQITDTLHESA